MSRGTWPSPARLRVRGAITTRLDRVSLPTSIGSNSEVTSGAAVRAPRAFPGVSDPAVPGGRRSGRGGGPVERGEPVPGEPVAGHLVGPCAGVGLGEVDVVAGAGDRHD